MRILYEYHQHHAQYIKDMLQKQNSPKPDNQAPGSGTGQSTDRKEGGSRIINGSGSIESHDNAQ